MGLNNLTHRCRAWIWLLCLLSATLQAAPADASSTAEVLEIEGTVEFLRSGSQVWDRIQIVNSTNRFLLYPGDQLRTRANSRALVRMSDQTRQRIGEHSHLRLAPKPTGGSLFRFFKGIYYFFHRDQPGQVELQTPTVSAVVRGTEFVLKVEDDGTTTISLVNGQVVMKNEFGELTLNNGEEGTTSPGQAPAKTARIITVKNIQWCLYYPALLHLDELPLDPNTSSALAASIQAYRTGDLPGASAAYPETRLPASPAEQIYLASLMLSAGKVDEARTLLQSIPHEASPSHLTRLAASLESLIHTVTLTPQPQPLTPVLATEWLAISYAHQADSRLALARTAARTATELAPEFSFAWARLAELEFSFGRHSQASTAAQRSLELAPRNAQALSLQGFLLAARNRTGEAIATFNRAIAIDGALGNAWLGRGLCRIRNGDSEAGRQDLLNAAALEPQRAFLRSYLGKAFHHVHDNSRARHELDLAKQLDPADPTPFLYSALILQQQNRINEAITDLEESRSLNNNRSLYRSRFLLDQDAAVRSVNLALLYQDAGLSEAGARQASEAIMTGYTSFPAHYFLANSYNSLRENGRVNLRYETAALNEYLLGNLLAPPAAGTLSPQVSQQEFSRLFERNRLGLVSTTEYLSRGDWTQSAAHYGILGNSSYALEAGYRSHTGQRPNHDLEQLSLSAQFKQQITPQDSLYLQTLYSHTESGDLSHNYSHSADDVRIKETQEPIALIGWNHEWQPGSHTLLLAGRLQDTLRVKDPTSPLLLFARDGTGAILAGPLGLLDPDATIAAPSLNYRSETEIHSAELQQLWQTGGHTLVAGSRFQTGTIDTSSDLAENATSTLLANNSMTFGTNQFRGSSTSSDISHNFQRISLYSYYTWNVFNPLAITAGLSYDHLQYPENFRNSPITDHPQTREQLSPKLGLMWTPRHDLTFRAAYTRSLGGVSFDQSLRLEPSQVAGFNQAYRSLIPESAAGTLEGARFETFSAALDHRLLTRTFVGVQFEVLQSDGNRTLGTEELSGFSFIPSSTRQNLDYEERNFTVTLNHLVGRHLSLGGRYRVSQAELDLRFSDIPKSVIDPINDDVEATLHQASLFAVFNHQTGIFSSVEALWSQQSNRGYTPGLPGDDFWQFNAFAGYRFPRRLAEVQLGLLNISDQDYNLNPLNLTSELPRERTVAARFKFSF